MILCASGLTPSFNSTAPLPTSSSEPPRRFHLPVKWKYWNCWSKVIRICFYKIFLTISIALTGCFQDPYFPWCYHDWEVIRKYGYGCTITTQICVWRWPVTGKNGDIYPKFLILKLG